MIKQELDATRLVSARLVAMSAEPYLDVALNTLTFVPVPLLGTFATDRWWRCYVDPVCVRSWSIEVIATVLRHEVRHCLMDHAGRAEQVPVPAEFGGDWNRAADATINPDIESSGRASWPFPVVHPGDIPGGRQGLTTDEFYQLLTAGRDIQGDPVVGAVQGRPGAGGASSGGSRGSGPGPAGDAGVSGDRAAGDGSAGPGSAAARRGTADAEHGCGGGSGVTGVPGWWELPDPGEDAGSSGVSNAVAEAVRRRTATRVRQHAQGKGRGIVPAGMVLWAEDYLTPTYDWRKELAARLIRSLSHLPGREDYTYRRPSRRHEQRRGGPLIPGLVVPEPPRVDAIVDTSGSMADVIGNALAETEGILRNRANTRVLFCDADVYDPQRGRSAKHLTVMGGGGTDMRVAMKRSADLRPRSDIQIVITDMGTPWPAKPYRPQQKVIIVGCTPEPTPEDQRPGWAKYVHVPTGAS